MIFVVKYAKLQSEQAGGLGQVQIIQKENLKTYIAISKTDSRTAALLDGNLYGQASTQIFFFLKRRQKLCLINSLRRKCPVFLEETGQ
jgi:hypothetical protein